jgi:carboxymethylenebutenolidase
MGNFGEQDHGIPPNSVLASEASMQLLAKPVDTKIYTNAWHAFENPDDKHGYQPEDAANALGRVDRSFEALLK